MDNLTNPDLGHPSVSSDADRESLKRGFKYHLKHTQAKADNYATGFDYYNSLSLVLRDRLVERWIQTQRSYHDLNTKRVYYLSMEYLVGRALSNYVATLDMRDEVAQAIRELGLNLEEIEQNDIEAGLGNGGLGRLATCFLDSMATLGLPCYGYGIRYEFGIFHQRILNGYQVETADNWYRRGNPWEIPRPQRMYPIKFFGRIKESVDVEGNPAQEWVDTHDDVMAMAHDIPIPGYGNNTVNILRLWSAKSTRELDFQCFNMGDYLDAVRHKQETETISKVLYPNDNVERGKELRLKQEYFFTSASLQDIIRRFKQDGNSIHQFPDKVAIQLNDTHPSLAIPELMRIFIDEEHLGWETAWDLCVRTFAFTNHTILPEAMEKWPVTLLEWLLPRHLQLIYGINERFLEKIELQSPGDSNRLQTMSLIEEQPVKSVRMAHMAVVGSHKVNGVAELHSKILQTKIFPGFYEMFSERFTNKTNGITQRLWLKSCNPGLSELISQTIGNGWITELSQLKQLVPLAEDAGFREQWARIKHDNKKRLAQYIKETQGIVVDPNSMFDVQIKRMHEYKRQLLNILHVVALYNRIRQSSTPPPIPRTVIFSGKAAPGYRIAKLIIKLINSVGERINNDPDVGTRLKVVFLPNYSVSLAEKIIPAANLSQQISTAGMEASGTGNMKLALNGALTIGTLDGANVEILQEVGEDNIFIFGLTSDDVHELNEKGYRPRDIYETHEELKNVLDMIRKGAFSPDDPNRFQPLVDSLLSDDYYKLLADFPAYANCQSQVESEFVNPDLWNRKSILNSANMGKFSSDRSIREYAEEIWGVSRIEVPPYDPDY